MPTLRDILFPPFVLPIVAGLGALVWPELWFRFRGPRDEGLWPLMVARGWREMSGRRWPLLGCAGLLFSLHLNVVQGFLFGWQAISLSQYFTVESVAFGTIGFIAFDLAYLAAINELRKEAAELRKEESIRPSLDEMDQPRMQALAGDWISLQIGHAIVYSVILSFISWLGSTGANTTQEPLLATVWLVAFLLYLLHLPTIEHDRVVVFPLGGRPAPGPDRR